MQQLGERPVAPGDVNDADEANILDAAQGAAAMATACAGEISDCEAW